MPHFVIDCSRNITSIQNPQDILLAVHEEAKNTNLFDEADIKVRLNPFAENYIVGGKQDNFIHVFANIMEGRSQDQKAQLSRQIVKRLTSMFPELPFIAMNVNDFEKNTYCNKSML